GGNFFIPDRNAYRIREVTASTGKINTVAGNGSSGSVGNGGPATLAELNTVYGLAINSSDTMFIADYYNLVIRKAILGGIITIAAGNGLTNFSGNNIPAAGSVFLTPWGAAADSNANVY